jgi:twinkle protein
MMHEKHKAWLDARGIDPVLAEKFGISTTRDGDGFWLTVPYSHAGETVNHKYRMTSEKRHRMDAGAPLALWNADCLSDPEVLSGASVIITEGEWDALTAIQAGFPFCVSVPNGAPAQATHEPENAKRYEFIWRHLDALNKVKSFIIATDGDPAGRALAADLVSLLGADRCKFVTYPSGCKDLNEVALKHGASTIGEMLNRAKPYPVKGLYTFCDFPPKAMRPHWSTGLSMLDDYIRIVPGTLTVFTGYANIGKSTVLSAIMAAQIENNIPVCIASFETEIGILRDSLRQAILKCNSYELAKADTTEVDALIEENTSIIFQAVDAEDEMDLDWFLERCRVAVLQHGAKMIVLDPWNELEHRRRRDETETEYTNRALREFRRFAERWNVAFWVVAHPAKPEKGFNGVPKLYQIAGSAAWANKPHYGLTYHRRDPSANSGELHVSKVKQGLPGKKTDHDGVKVMLDYRSWQFVPDTFA